MARALIFAAALTLSGCIDFVAPEREPPSGGGFAVSLWVTNDSEARLTQQIEWTVQIVPAA